MCFSSYLTTLMTRIKPECKQSKLIMVLDNHTAHKGPNVMAKLATFC